MAFSVLWCVTCAFVASMASSESTTTTIPLNKTLIYNDKELFGDFYTIKSSSSLTVNFTAVNKKLSFIVFQVHSHLYNVTLRKSTLAIPLVGTNIGFYSSVVEGLGTYTIENGNNFDLRVFVGVFGYGNTDPIPGGCNMEFSIPISPYMKTKLYNKTYIDIEVAPPQNRPLPCQYPFPMKFYLMYLPEKNYDPDVYFEGIRRMSNLKSILEYGTRIPQSSENYWTMRRRISAYPGTGAIFVAVAQVNNTRYSVYVPTHSYGCSPLLEYDCEILNDDLSMLLSSVLLFLGLFICYFGHRFFKTQIMSFGFLSGFVCTYIVLYLICDIDGPALVAASALSGLFFGGLRLVCWWLYGIPAFIIVLSSADFGFLVASMFYYMSPGGVFLYADLVFWSSFIIILLAVTLCLLSTSYIASLICCAVIGAYTAIYPMDYYIGSNLKYIMTNAVRRATVTGFNKAVIMPIYQWKDIFLTLTAITLAITGFIYQYYNNRGRPPFPPPPRSVRAVPEYPMAAVVRRRSSIARYWEKWRQRRRERANLRHDINERTPLLEEE